MPFPFDRIPAALLVRRAYVLDLYRADCPVRVDELRFLGVLPSFDLLAIKTCASRTAELCPPRAVNAFSLSLEACAFLAGLGIKAVAVDCACQAFLNLPLLSVGTLMGVAEGFYARSDEVGEQLSSPSRLPMGVRRDGSLYTRIQWANGTVKNPYYWVSNLIDDDLERFGGTWGANTMGPAHVILDFFNERQRISCVRLFNNCGAPHSLPEEMVCALALYVSDDERCARFGNFEQAIDAVPWKKILAVSLDMREQWSCFFLEQTVEAKYLRLTLEKNHGTPEDVPWVELSELKLYP